MKNKIAVAALLALTSVGALATTAFAQCGTGVFIDWDGDAFAYETNYNPATFISAAGSQLTVVGKIVLFCSPLADLVPSAGTEYTFVWSGLTSLGTVVTPLGGTSTRYTTDYGPGQFFIYEDGTPDAPSAGAMPPNPPNALVPSSFADGTLILQGSIVNLKTIVTLLLNGNYATSFAADYDFTGPIGGTYFDRVDDFGVAKVAGLWCATGTANGLCGNPEGYSAHPNGKFDLPPATATTVSTWGAIKQLYR